MPMMADKTPVRWHAQSAPLHATMNDKKAIGKEKYHIIMLAVSGA